MILSLLTLLTSYFASAAPLSLIENFPNEVLRNEVVEFKVIKGHHFSAEAPQDCGSGSVTQKSTRGVKCLFAQAGATHPQLNVCDDAKTFCRPIHVSVNVVRGASNQPAVPAQNAEFKKDLKQKLVPGWNEGTPTEISRQAANNQQPVLVMVSTDWCPSCNEAKEYLLPGKNFSDVTKDWFKVYVDGDSLTAKEWNSIVPFKFYPSFVLLNSKMEEVGRYTGPIRQAEFEAWAKDELKNLESPLKTIKPRVEERAQGSWVRKIRDLFTGVNQEVAQQEKNRLFKNAYDRGDNDAVNKLLLYGEYPELTELVVRSKLTELDRQSATLDAQQKEEMKNLILQLADLTFKSNRWAENLASFCEFDKDACKPLLLKVPERLEFLSKRTGLFDAEKDSQLAEEYLYITLAYQALGDQSALKQFATKCAERFEAMSKSTQLTLSRAGSQGMVACLELSGDLSRGEKVVDNLIKAYPNEPTFLLRKARMMRKQKKPELALEWANKAEAYAFGYNWYGLQLLKGELLLELKKPDQTKRIVEQTLAQVRVDSSQDFRNQSLVERLRGLQLRASN